MDANTVTASHFVIDDFSDTRAWEWEPQEDITAHELALCMPMLFFGNRGYQTAGMLGQMYDGLPANAQRHFRVTG